MLFFLTLFEYFISAICNFSRNCLLYLVIQIVIVCPVVLIRNPTFCAIKMVFIRSIAICRKGRRLIGFH